MDDEDFVRSVGRTAVFWRSAVRGYRTTWGAAGFEAQHFDYDAEVVTRLDRAGAVRALPLDHPTERSSWDPGRRPP